jgi:choline dehydrogenase-like flavoprotein
VCDENGPLWGQELVDVARKYRHWIGLLLMCNDDNNGVVGRDEDGNELITSNFQPAETERMRRGADFSADVLRAAGATRVLWSGPATTHMQGSARMGSDASNSVVDRNGESHDVKRLFVGDSSLIPRTLSVNPSLTIMALATRLAEHLDANERGYLRGNRELVA